MVSDASIEKLLDWLRDQAPAAAQARANRIYVEEYRKSLKASLMAEHKDKPLGVQEREAYADPRYIEHLTAIRAAVEQDERMRWMMTAADAKLEAWRTSSANERMKAKIT